jgi:hypothetical protein
VLINSLSPIFMCKYFLVSAAVVAALLFASSAHGRIFFVTDPQDTTNQTSLRGAILEANKLKSNQKDPHTAIILLSGTYQLTLTGGDEDFGRSGDLDIIQGSVTIAGRGSNVTINATGLGDRVFQVFSNAHLTLSHLIIQGGTAPMNDYQLSEAGASGGAIFNSGTLTIQNCSIGGNSSGNGGFGVIWIGLPGGDGGGIYNEGFARLDRCIINDNSAGAGAGQDSFGFGHTGGNGGGIYNSGIMFLNNCTISTNMSGQGGSGGVASGLVSVNAPGGPGGAGGNGAGIFNAGEMELNFCTVNGNDGGDGGDGGFSLGSGGNAGAGGNGAGIFNTGNLSLKTSTISGNFCGGGGAGGKGSLNLNFGFLGGGVGGNGGNGGGIYNAGSFNATSCTISLNVTGAAGTGGRNRNDDGNNADTTGSDGIGGSGGGIANEADGAAISLRNALVALNSNGSGFGPDLAGEFAPHGFNLIGAADGSTGFTNGVKANQVGSIANPIDPLLGPLQMNGGFTSTHALLSGSPAIDKGNSYAIHRDQRGHYRPVDFTVIPSAIGGDSSDIGAFELSVPPRK